MADSFLSTTSPASLRPESEEIVRAIAAQAAVAIDNAGLLQAARIEMDSCRKAEKAAQQLAAIVESSEDAILTKDLDGIIISWNQGAERLFGYAGEEVIGKSIAILIPMDRLDEEPIILSRIRQGERVDHYETVRRRKDGSLVEISLTVSPVRNAAGEIVGASKIARDITERRRAQEQQRLLLREMNHRIRNLFALCSGVVTLSARSAKTPQDLAFAVRERLGALARAHGLTLSQSEDIAKTEQPATLHALIQTIVAPYDPQENEDESRVAVSGPDIPIASSSVTSLALLLHEFATNATKYGALSTPAGRVDINCLDDGDRFVLTWTERGGPRIDHVARSEGFGSLLARATVKGQLNGELSREWKPEGLTIRLAIPRDHLAANASP